MGDMLGSWMQQWVYRQRLGIQSKLAVNGPFLRKLPPLRGSSAMLCSISCLTKGIVSTLGTILLACGLPLGHELQGPVVGHSFWGSSAVLESLKKCRGWNEGYVMLGPDCVQRD